MYSVDHMQKLEHEAANHQRTRSLSQADSEHCHSDPESEVFPKAKASTLGVRHWASGMGTLTGLQDRAEPTGMFEVRSTELPPGDAAGENGEEDSSSSHPIKQ